MDLSFNCFRKISEYEAMGKIITDKWEKNNGDAV